MFDAHAEIIDYVCISLNLREPWDRQTVVRSVGAAGMACIDTRKDGAGKTPERTECVGCSAPAFNCREERAS